MKTIYLIINYTDGHVDKTCFESNQISPPVFRAATYIDEQMGRNDFKSFELFSELPKYHKELDYDVIED